MIYVTHDQVEAMTLADKIVVLDAGRVAQWVSRLSCITIRLTALLRALLARQR
jgi:ABC-type sugar transport system ATPase subunit